MPPLDQTGHGHSGAVQKIFGARSYVGPRRLAAGGPRAPFTKHNSSKE